MEKERGIRTVTGVFVLVLFLVAVAYLVNGCCPKITEHVVTITRDSTIVEVRDRIIHDTAKVEIPIIIEKNITKDDSSHIENKFAVSDAWVKDGLLHHSLSTRPQIIDVPVDVHVTDTTKTHEHYEKADSTSIRYVNVEKPLSWWQEKKIGAFPWLFCGLILCFLWIFRKPLFRLIGMR